MRDYLSGVWTGVLVVTMAVAPFVVVAGIAYAIVVTVVSLLSGGGC